MDMRLLERFMSKVKTSEEGCWTWNSAISSSGITYGIFWKNGKNAMAHRLSYELFVGPPGDLNVCHRCDNGLCVRPSHLFLATPKQNSADMVAKGRSAKGHRIGVSKLTSENVIEIRSLSRSGVSRHEIARRFRVARPSIVAILSGETWKHIKEVANV